MGEWELADFIDLGGAKSLLYRLRRHRHMDLILLVMIGAAFAAMLIVSAS
ncbi:MAG: hypothetical protein HPY61_07060 [Methanotrichaceae archaeon]|nr:hypothetical protein [Methanotrichaceae archaeon]